MQCPICGEPQTPGHRCAGAPPLLATGMSIIGAVAALPLFILVAIVPYVLSGSQSRLGASRAQTINLIYWWIILLATLSVAVYLFTKRGRAELPSPARTLVLGLGFTLVALMLRFYPWFHS